VRPTNWAIERLKRKRQWQAREQRGSPAALVLVRTVASRQVVVGMCGAARARGVRAGMSLAQARALCPGIVHTEQDAGRDAKTLEALGRWMIRFTPTVQVTEGGIFLDVTGTQRLLGSPEDLLARIEGHLAELRIPAQLAIAPTVGAAWALTFANSRTVAEDLPAALAPLSPGVLRLEEEALATLHHLGLHTVGQVMALPRELLPARFGPTLLMRIDQALGRIAEPLVPLQYHPPIEASTDFDGIIDSLEALWLTFKNLITEVVEHLVRRGLGARQLTVTFLRPYAPSIEKTIDLSQPSRNASILFNLIRCAMETIGDARPKRGKRAARFEVRGGQSARPAGRVLDETDFVPRGFIGLRLAVPVFERLSEEQISLLEQEEHLGRQELDRLLERVRIRLGQEGMVEVEAVESHVPERAYKEGSGFGVQGSGKKRQARPASLLSSSEPYALNPARLSSPKSEPSCRPLHLLSMPCELRVMVRPSYDRDGAPVAFMLDGESHRIVHAVGPERIAGAWWLGNDKTRDYFDVEDESGRRWWLFRVLQSSKWYLHGTFE
jgi:protein ImuB